MLHAQTQQAKDEYVETYSISGSVSILKPLFSATMKDEHKIDIVSSVSQSASQTSGQAATLFLTGPNTGYTGPTDLQVYQDTVYGTFLFAFVPETAPGFALSAAPATQAVAAGGSATYTVSAAPLNGFSGAVTLSATGGPACGGVTFSPATIAGAGAPGTPSPRQVLKPRWWW